MSVILNEGALKVLLESQEGPVGRFVERVADAVVVEAQRNVVDYFGTAPSLQGRVDQDIDSEMQGSTAVVGIKDGGSKARRLATYQAEGRVNWLQRAIETVRARFGS